MIACEIEAPIVNRCLNISSDFLPMNVSRAKIIVMYEESEVINSLPPIKGGLASFLDNPIKVKSFSPLSREEANAR